MQIFFGINSLLPISIGGTELYIQNLAHALIKRGYRVSVVCGTIAHETQRKVWEGLPVIALPVNNKELIKTQVINLFSQHKPEVFHLHSTGEIFNAHTLKWIYDTGVKCFFTPHLANNFCITLKKPVITASSVYQCLDSQIKNAGIKLQYPLWFIFMLTMASSKLKILRRMVPDFYFNSISRCQNLKLLKINVHGTVSLSPWVTAYLKINNFQNIVEIPQGVKMNVRESKKDFRTKAGNKIAFVGRISKEKRIEIIIEALRLIDNKTVQLIVIASVKEESAYFKELLKSAEDLNIVFHINKSQEEVMEILGDCKALCLASNIREVAPLVVEEARSLKIVSIVSEINKECFYSRKGLLFFKTDDSHELANLIRQMDSPLFESKKEELNGYKPIGFDEIACHHINLYGFEETKFKS